MQEQKAYYDVNDIMKITGYSSSKCYKTIRDLAKELKNKGFIIPTGLIPASYFLERTGLSDKK